MKWRLILAPLALGVALIGSIGYTSATIPSKTRAVGTTRQHITFWHSMNGPNELVLDRLVDRFNASQSRYQVDPVYAGSYDLSIMKYANVIGSQAEPDLIQVDQARNAMMVGLDSTTPTQTFVDRDHYDLSPLYAGVRQSYTVAGKLVAMPFNSSSSVIYYNKDLFARYGVPDLPKSPSYRDITQAAVTLTQRAHGAVKGLTIQIYGWLPEELAANQNSLIVDHGNGRQAMATKAMLNTLAMHKTMTWLQSVIQQGAFQNYGTGAAAGTNQNAGFLAQKVGIFMQSSALLGQLQTAAKFRYGVAFTPHPDGTPANGVAIGGASLWIAKHKPRAVQAGAWAFERFMMTPAAQADWQLGTGYFAVNRNATRIPRLAQAIQQNPALNVPIEQLNAGRVNAATAGAFFNNISSERTYMETAMQQIYAGQAIDKALATAERATNADIAATNAANGAMLDYPR
ncbi:ABC transporter substrate-binding protein [Lacticaseibacillus absianus]|uniref:ABC transporter substrate-binding protein n=1 Tax=Lacticaseibacillus absianus TaxID=2729623 RepID=UPI0015CC2E20|nr:ABC transporter substrate-binding protein [Lacticaseibacillus absianus]